MTITRVATPACVSRNAADISRAQHDAREPRWTATQPTPAVENALALDAQPRSAAPPCTWVRRVRATALSGLHRDPLDNEQGPAKSPRSVVNPDAQQRSEALKERLYVTSTTLAVTIAYDRDADHVTVDGVARTLLLTVLGTIMAVLVADVVAYMVKNSALPTGRELAHLGYVSFGSSGVIVVPMGIIGISAAGLIDVATSLRAISATLAVTLVVVTLLAVQNLRVGPWRKALALAITAALGLAALSIELAVH